MDALKNVLARRMQQTGLKKQIETALILEEANKAIADIFGPVNSAKIKPLYFKQNVLYIACVNSIVSQELNLKKGQIIETISKKFPIGTIEKIKFII